MSGFLDFRPPAPERTFSVPSGATIAQIQVALDAAAAMSGAAAVTFAPGAVYTITQDLNVGSGTQIIGNSAIFIQNSTGRRCVLALAPGVSDVAIRDLDLRGPWYGIDSDAYVGGGNLTVWNADYADNTGIDIRGRFYQRQVLGYSKAQMEALTDEHRNIRISGCTIEGFGQSGILADQVSVFRASGNNIYRCGRDGIRMYGVVRGAVVGNDIGDLFAAYSDGLAPNFNMYGVAATRLYGKAGFEDPDNLIGRPTQDVLIMGNHVFKCPTWKGLDTHGGARIQFIGNTIEDCNICIGLDKGGYDAVTGYAPPRDILISGNTLRATSASKYMRAGITAYGHDATDQNILDGLVVSGNIFDGVGGNDTDATVSLSNARSATITGNTFRNSPRAAIALVLEVRGLTLTGNVFHNPVSYVTASVGAAGTGYTTRPTVEVSGGGGTGLKAIAIIASGSVTSISILHPGTGYTSAPTLTLTGGGGTGATATAQFTNGFGVLSQTPTARAVIGGNSFTNIDQAATTAVSLQSKSAGYGVKVSADNTYFGTVTQVVNAATEDGGTRKSTALAWANINLSVSSASISAGYGVASVTRAGIGNVQVTLAQTPAASNSFTVVPAVKGSVPYVFAVNATSAGVFNVRVFDLTGAPVDVGFYITVNGY